MTRKFQDIWTAAAIFATTLSGAPAIAAPVGAGLVYTVIIPGGDFGSDNYTEVVTGSIAAAQRFCADLDNDSYKVDCLSERLGAISNKIPKNSDYAEIRSILKDTSDQLAELARANRDPNQPRGRATQQGGEQISTTRPLTPVTPSSVSGVNAEARAILDNTETLLLRSAEGSESKALQYSRIADAIGSSKVLLRST